MCSSTLCSLVSVENRLQLCKYQQAESWISELLACQRKEYREWIETRCRSKRGQRGRDHGRSSPSYGPNKPVTTELFPTPFWRAIILSLLFYPTSPYLQPSRWQTLLQPNSSERYEFPLAALFMRIFNRQGMNYYFHHIFLYANITYAAQTTSLLFSGPISIIPLSSHVTLPILTEAVYYYLTSPDLGA